MKDIVDFYPLTPMQQGMLFHSRFAPESGVYVEQMSCKITGLLDPATLTQAWQRVIDRHPILRTSFIGEGLKEPVQAVHQNITVTIPVHDHRGLPPEEQEAVFHAYLQTDQLRGFDLSQPPSMRFSLFRHSDNCWRFLWTHHHILLDGWSSPMLMQEVFAFYEAFMSGKPFALELPPPFRSYVAWLRRQDTSAAEKYWRSTLRGFSAPTPLPEDWSAAQPAEPGFSEEESWLPPDLSHSLAGLAQRERVTLSTLLLGAWMVLLHRLTRSEDVVVGATVSGRPPDLPGAERMIGLFINTLPVRAQISPDVPFIHLLQTLHRQQIEMRQFEYSPLVQVHGWSDLPRSQPLFESLYVFENYPTQAIIEGRQSSLILEEFRSSEQTNYALNLIAGAADRVMLKIGYDPAHYHPGSIRSMLQYLRRILEGLADNPTCPPDRLPLQSAEERQALISMWNNTRADVDLEKTVVDEVATAAQCWPDLPAIRYEEQELSYHQLETRAGQVASAIVRRGARPGELIGILLENGIDLPAAILGVLKAGCGYLPLDPNNPPERLASMLEDSGARLLLTQSELVKHIHLPAAESICMDQASDLDGPHARLIHRAPKADDLAYVIYTSGSTGQPKGTLLRHGGLQNLLTDLRRNFKFNPGERTLLFNSISFDAAVMTIFLTLTTGGTLVLAPKEKLVSPPELAALIRREQVVHAFLMPAIISLLEPADLPGIRTIFTGGEACPVEAARRWVDHCVLVNAYGPTEATIVSSYQVVKAVPVNATRISIGRPVANTRSYILDHQMEPVPPGIPGELYIGGLGVAGGYRNRLDLTEERFLPDPYSPGERMYRTGDLVRGNAEGAMEFLGRLDNQVKIRGFRVELAEIEAALGRHPGIQAAVIDARPEAALHGSLRLVAYVIPRDGSTPDLGDVRAFLKSSLPDYMLPSALVEMEQFPMLSSGKVDRKSLPQPTAETPLRREVREPKTGLEAQIQQIWEEVLGVHPISVDDNFFDLGGHSLLALRVIAQVKEKLGRPVSLAALFQNPSVAALAGALEADSAVAAQQEENDSLVPLQKNGSRPPFFLVHPSGGSVHWYAPLAAALGSSQPVFAFQARGVNDERPIHTTIEAMASYYVQALRHAQPEGPYRLGSWSMGVMIAYEMAQQLREMGQRVSLLVMLDQGPVLPVSQAEDDAAYLYETFHRQFPLKLETLRRLSPDEQIALVYQRARARRWMPADISLEQFRRFVVILRTHTEAWRAYRPQPYPGPITVIRAKGERRAHEDRRDLGWGRLVASDIEVIDVPGDHLSMLRPPHLQVLAKALRACLDRPGEPQERR